VSTINGLILAGGESSRMGEDKSLLDFHGKTQREHLHGLLGKFCKKVFLSCRAIEQIPIHLNPIPDHYNFKSPLNGILSAFNLNAHTALLSLPVDMPYIDEKIISHLITNRQKSKVATCFYDSDGKEPEPLFAIWEPHALPLLMAYYQSGKFTPRGFLQNHDVAVLPSPDPRLHININSQDDLKHFRKRNHHSS
jgi:molybdopterin-guanine dinucleotide biosynthesis protein A